MCVSVLSGKIGLYAPTSKHPMGGKHCSSDLSATCYLIRKKIMGFFGLNDRNQLGGIMCHGLSPACPALALVAVTLGKSFNYLRLFLHL